MILFLLIERAVLVLFKHDCLLVAVSYLYEKETVKLEMNSRWKTMSSHHALTQHLLCTKLYSNQEHE